MPRIPRKDFKTHYFHTMVQGLNREFIFGGVVEKKKYNSLMRKYLVDELVLLGNCLMGNHAHLVLYAEEISNLSKAMQKMNTSYAEFYNKKHDRVGPVFRGRFTIQPIYSRKQLYRCLAYIHYNPVKAEIVSKMEDYDYSSYSDFLYGRVNKKVLKLIFEENAKDYKEIFEKIHQKKCLREEYLEEFEMSKKPSKAKILKEFLEKNQITMSNLRRNDDLIIEISKIMEKECEISKREIARFLEINREKLRKLMK